MNPRSTPTTDRFTDPGYLRFQYDDDERLRTRIETHRRYSENGLDFHDWLVQCLAARPGTRVLDVGSGPGIYHDRLGDARLVALDLSAGMLAKVAVPKVRADAQALPFRDRSFERVLCAYVLFHVRDIPRALAELRRVLAPGGRVVIATNSRTTMQRLLSLQNTVARELGLPEEFSVAARFGLEDVDVVRAVFPTVRVEVFEDAFRFESAEPVLAYVASMSVGTWREADRGAFLARLRERVDAIIAREGMFRVPKRSGCLVADV